MLCLPALPRRPTGPFAHRLSPLAFRSPALTGPCSLESLVTRVFSGRATLFSGDSVCENFYHYLLCDLVRLGYKITDVRVARAPQRTSSPHENRTLLPCQRPRRRAVFPPPSAPDPVTSRRRQSTGTTICDHRSRARPLTSRVSSPACASTRAETSPWCIRSMAEGSQSVRRALAASRGNHANTSRNHESLHTLADEVVFVPLIGLLSARQPPPPLRSAPCSDVCSPLLEWRRCTGLSAVPGPL